MTRISGSPHGPLKIALMVLLAAMLAVPGLAAKERRGAKVVVTKLDKSVVRGELLIVNGETLTVLDSMAIEVSLNLREVREIDMATRAGGAAAIAGALGLGVLGATYGAEHGKGGPILLGGLGALTGGMLGGLIAGLTDVMSVDFGDEKSLRRIILRLKKHARFRN